MNNDKCSKYEGLFVFANEQDCSEHLKKCPDCQAEDEKMKKVSSLIREVAPLIRAKSRNRAKLKLACVSFGLIFSFLTLGVVNFDQDIHDIILYGQTMSVEDYGFPVDSYGLIMVD